MEDSDVATGALRIDGSRTLPPGYPHPHASEQARRIAQDGMMLRVQVGSSVHGTSISGQDDHDEMGICLEPARSHQGPRLPKVAQMLSGVNRPRERVRSHLAYWQKDDI